MSNAVKRMFPAPAFRPSDYPGMIPVCFRVSIAEDGVDAEARMPGLADGEPAAKASARLRLDPAKTPDRTRKAVENAFSRLGGTDYRFESLELCDDSSLFVPASVLNDLRRELVEKLDDARAAARRAKVASALDGCC